MAPLNLPHRYRPFNVRRADGTGFESGVAGNAPEIARKYAAPGEEDEAERAVTLARGAANYGSDALVTMNPLLLEGFPRGLVQGANPMTPRDAVALLGLFLRVRGDFAFEVSPSFLSRMSRDTFYFVLMRDLTPKGWRWFSACVDSANHTDDESVMMIAQSGMGPIEHALRARDHLHEALQVPPTPESATDAIFYFDVTLLMLGGALDALALVAHRAHGTSTKDYEVGWVRKKWMAELKTLGSPLASVMAEGQPHRDARDLVAVMRNTIHSEAFSSVTWVGLGKRDERIVVPPAVAPKVLEIADRISSPHEFGLASETGGTTYVQPGQCVEAMLPRFFDAINAIMDATPVEALPGVDATTLMVGPPNDGIFSEAVRTRVRLFAGID